MRICGVDEVGCSAIAGPVVVCAALIDTSVQRLDGVDDSKKLSRIQREDLAPLIRERAAFAFGAAGPRRIEKINIYWARYEAMRIAVMKLLRRGLVIDLVIVDGNRTISDLPDGIRQEARVKADETVWEVSCASILAKVHRDNLMSALAGRERNSHYGWETNAGYPTPEHHRGIIQHGATGHHRRTFASFKRGAEAHASFVGFRANGGTLEEFLKRPPLATDKECAGMRRDLIRAGRIVPSKEDQ